MTTTHPKATFFLEEGKHRVHVRSWGDGPIPVIALHGFSDDGSLFSVLAPAFAASPSGKTCTIYAPDLPFHGKTEWRSAVFSRRRLRSIVFKIAARHPEHKPILLGYSYGGRLAMSAFPRQFHRLGALWLFAPAGLDNPMTRWSWLHPLRIRLLLIKLLGKEKTINWLADFGKRTGILSRVQYQFFMFQTRTPYLRQQLYSVWISLALFPVRKKWLVHVANRIKLPVLVVWGTRDVITPIKQMTPLREIKNLKIVKVQDGHRLVNDQLAARLAEELPDLLAAYFKNVRAPMFTDKR